MKLTKMLLAGLVLATVAFTSCKPKDADVKTAIETKMNAIPELAGAVVDVKEGVATITGELKNEADKAKVAEATKDIKGLKSVIDNTTIPAPVVVAPVVVSADDLLIKAVTDATKDFPTAVTSVKDGIITVTGELSVDKWKKLKMILDGLKPKKVDAASLKIK